MAGKIKGITIQIGADTKPLEKSLEGVNKNARAIQSELRQVDRLLKLDVDLAQKQKLLEAVSNTKDKQKRRKFRLMNSLEKARLVKTSIEHCNEK